MIGTSFCQLPSKGQDSIRTSPSRLYYNTISQPSNVKRSFSEPYEVDISMIFAHHLCFTAAYQDCAYHMPGSCKCCVPVDSVGDR